MLERAPGILGGPAPLGIHGPQRYVREHDHGRAAGERGQVFSEPLDLIFAESAHALALVLEHIDEADEVRALVVEALPAAPADRALAVALEVFLAAVQEDVVLAWQIETVLGLQPLEDLGDGVEGAGLLAVRLIARVEHERRRGLERVDSLHDLLEGRRRVAVGLALETDVRVADLGKAKALGFGLRGGRR